jgi:hypothetical protein
MTINTAQEKLVYLDQLSLKQDQANTAFIIEYSNQSVDTHHAPLTAHDLKSTINQDDRIRRYRFFIQNLTNIERAPDILTVPTP